MEKSTAQVAEEARAFVREKIKPIFTKEGALRVPAMEYEFLVRNDSRGVEVDPETLLTRIGESLGPDAVVEVYAHVPT